MNIRKIKRFINLILRRDYCPFCDCFTHFKSIPVRKRCMCPYCGSLERHRFLLSIFQSYFLNSDLPLRILHTAPEKCFSDRIALRKNIAYYPVDLMPENFPDVACQKADVTALPFSNDFFDFILSNHVLEHIPDETAFLSEMKRVLVPDGKILITFPVDWTRETTLEDPSIQSPEDRTRYYGQCDHVRLYGRDVENRLGKFFHVKKFTQNDIQIYGNQRLSPHECCFLLTKKEKQTTNGNEE